MYRFLNMWAKGCRKTLGSHPQTLVINSRHGGIDIMSMNEHGISTKLKIDCEIACDKMETHRSLRGNLIWTALCNTTFLYAFCLIARTYVMYMHTQHPAFHSRQWPCWICSQWAAIIRRFVSREQAVNAIVLAHLLPLKPTNMQASCILHLAHTKSTWKKQNVEEAKKIFSVVVQGIVSGSWKQF